MRLAALSGLLVVCLGVAYGQSVQGVVTGTVFDSSGGVLPKAAVALTNVGTSISQSEITANDGAFRFNLVPPGKYTVVVKAPGFTEKQIRDVVVNASQVTPVNVTLSVSGATQTVEVQAQETLVQTATAELATTVGGTFITNIPLLSRNVYDLAFLAPTVTQGMDLKPASGGSRQSGTAYLLNGADNNDNFSEGSSNIEPALESVAEFSMLTNSMSAQYGRAGGVVISAVQRSGANDWHGVGYEFFRNQALNATDFFQNRQGSPKPDYKRNQFGGFLGGPIVKNKTFFAFAFDRTKTSTADDIDEQVLTPSALSQLQAGAGPLAKSILGIYQLKTSTTLCPNEAVTAPDAVGYVGCIHANNPIENGRNTYYGKVDHNFSASDRIAVSVNFARQLNTNTYGGGHASAQPINELDHNNYHNLSLVETHIFNPRVINEFTVAHNRHQTDSLAALNGNSNIPAPEILIDGADWGLGVNIGAFEGFNSAFTQDRWQLQDNFSIVSGKHTFKIGGSYQYGIVYRNWDLGSPGQYEFGTAFGNPFAKSPDGTLTGVDPVDDSNFQRDVPYYQEIAVDPRSGKAANAYRHYMMKDSSLFVQDDWKFSPRLTINVGLRWERYGAPSEANGNIAQFTDLNASSRASIASARVAQVPSMWKTKNGDFGPRVGLAYDVFGNGRTSLRAGFGMFFDRIFDNVWSNGAWNPPFYALLDLDASAGDKINYAVPSAPGAVFAAGAALPRVSVRTMDVAMHDSGIFNYSFAIDQQLKKDYLFRLTYQGNQGRHLPVLMNLNRYDGMRYNATFADARPNSAYTGFNYRANNVNSNYNSLITELQKRMSNGLQFQFSYTFSKLIDSGSDLFAGETTQGSYSQPYYSISNAALNLEKGPGAFDHTHSYKLALIYSLPFFKDQHGFAGKVLGGWVASTFYQSYSGHPLEVYTSRTRKAGNAKDANGIPENVGGDYNYDGVANDRPTFIGNMSSAYSGWSPADGIFSDNNRIGCSYAGMASTNAAALCQSSFGVSKASTLFTNPGGTGVRFGTLGRNVFRGPWFNGLDAKLQKEFRITERQTFGVHFDALNLLNHPNFDGITTDLNSANFGRAQILVGSAPARRLQLGVRYEF